MFQIFEVNPTKVFDEASQKLENIKFLVNFYTLFPFYCIFNDNNNILSKKNLKISIPYTLR